MPGHPIPEPFKWDESFRTFYEQIDKEHQGLFDGIFACCEKPGDAATLADLVRLIDEHFAAEEATMQKKNYAGYADHKKIHGEFTKKLKELKAPLTDANLHFAKEWLVNHIKDVDFKYKDKL